MSLAWLSAMVTDGEREEANDVTPIRACLVLDRACIFGRLKEQRQNKMQKRWIQMSSQMRRVYRPM
jgi:hypothetical protein